MFCKIMSVYDIFIINLDKDDNKIIKSPAK